MFSLHNLPKALLGLWLLLLPTVASSQQPVRDPIERAKQYVEKAEDYYSRAQFEASIKEFQFASQIYRQQQRTDLYGICYNGVGNNYIDMTRYADAYMEFSRVLYQYQEMMQVDTAFRPDSTIIADAYEGLGRFFMNAQENLVNKRLGNEKAINFDTAVYYHQRALDLRSRLLGEKSPKVALSYYFLAKCYGSMQVDTLQEKENPNYVNPLAMQLQYLQKALSLQLATVGEKHYQTADTYDALGDYYYSVPHDYQKGMEYYQKSLQIRKSIFGETHPKIAESYIGLASYYRILSVFDSELDYLEKALNIRLQILGNEHKDIATNYFLLANRYRATGDLDKAQTYYAQALGIYEKLQGSLSIEVADVYQQMALCYRDMNETRMERNYLDKAFNIRKKNFGGQHLRVADSYMELGNFFLKHPTLFSTKQLQDSISYYYKMASQIWEKQLGKNNPLSAQLLDNYAKVYYLLGDENTEISYLKQALEAKQLTDKQSQTQINRFEMSDADFVGTSHEEDNPKTIASYQLFDSYLNLARFYRRKKDYQVALVYVQKALVSVSGSLYGDNLYENPTLSELSRNLTWVEALQEKADLFRLQYLEQSKSVKDIEFAQKTYQLALNLMDTLRVKFSSDASRQQLTLRSISLYEGAINTYYTLFQLTQKEDFLEQAFQTAERSKAFVLLQALHNLRARGFGDVPVELLIEEERLRQSITYYAAAQKKKGADVTHFQKAYFEKRRSYDSLISVIETQYPKYHKLKYKTQVSSTLELREKVIGEQAVLLEYFLGDEHLYCFRLSKQGTQFFQVPLPRNYSNQIMNLRRNLTDFNAISEDPLAAFQQYTENAYQLYKDYVAPFLQGISAENTQKLIIVPDGVFSYVPFETLLQEAVANKNQINYKDLRYLLRDYQINYAYSSTLLAENMNHGRISNNRQCLGFAPTYENANAAGAKEELPWAEKELKAIQSVYSGDYFYGNMATKDQFIGKAPDYGIIHLAMHGLADTRHPLNSKLAFAPVNGQQDDRAFLYAYEINNMKLNADLVVLSACETGFGKALRGEGVVSLAWTFMYAGAPSVVTTLWPVNDFTSSTIMTHFYQNLYSGYEKPEALRLAKLKFLESSDHISGHPIFWASFITIGDPSPVSVGWAWWVWVLIVLSFTGMGFLAFRWYQKRRQHKVLPMDSIIQSDADALLGLLNNQQPQNPDTTTPKDKEDTAEMIAEQQDKTE